MKTAARILYCHCAYARIIPKEVKEEVLEKLSKSGIAFEAVADLCEMSARHDPALKRLGGSGPLKIAACYPRAVQWLFNAAGAPLPDGEAQIINMRVETAESVVDSLLDLSSPERKGEP